MTDDLLAYTKFLPHGAALGLALVSFDAALGRCTLKLPFREELLGDPERRIVHGGVITTLLDTLGAACVAVRGKRPQATLDLRIDYLRPSTPDLDLIGEGVCHHITRHIAFVRAACHQGDPARPIANMTATFMLQERPANEADRSGP